MYTPRQRATQMGETQILQKKSIFVAAHASCVHKQAAPAALFATTLILCGLRAVAAGSCRFVRIHNRRPSETKQFVKQNDKQVAPGLYDLFILYEEFTRLARD